MIIGQLVIFFVEKYINGSIFQGFRTEYKTQVTMAAVDVIRNDMLQAFLQVS